LGYVIPPVLIHANKEQFWRDLGEAIGTIRYCEDIVIDHVDYSAGEATPDTVYLEANFAEARARDDAAYELYLTTRFQDDVRKLASMLQAYWHPYGKAESAR
jgi:hypothetical protein